MVRIIGIHITAFILTVFWMLLKKLVDVLLDSLCLSGQLEVGKSLSTP